MIQARAAALINTFISVLYSEGFWVRSRRAHVLGRMLRAFLLLYQKCARECWARGMNRFALVPKAHMLSHTAEDLIDQADKASWVINPLSTSNQQQEDYIGRPCRLSRRVHACKLHTRVLERSLLAAYQALQ